MCTIYQILSWQIKLLPYIWITHNSFQNADYNNIKILNSVSVCSLSLIIFQGKFYLVWPSFFSCGATLYLAFLSVPLSQIVGLWCGEGYPTALNENQQYKSREALQLVPDWRLLHLQRNISKIQRKIYSPTIVALISHSKAKQTLFFHQIAMLFLLSQKTPIYATQIEMQPYCYLASKGRSTFSKAHKKLIQYQVVY